MATRLSTLQGKQQEISDDSLSELRMQLRGEALTPADTGYENVRAPFNAMHVDRPSLVVRCTGTADVVDAVNFARENGIEVTVRGGGHSPQRLLGAHVAGVDVGMEAPRQPAERSLHLLVAGTLVQAQVVIERTHRHIPATKPSRY